MIAYKDTTTGVVHQCSLMSSVPDGETGFTVTPMEDKVFREALDIVAGDLVIDQALAIEVTHNLRRADRDAKMTPYDEIIKLQIPGDDAVAAEASRQTIRNDNAILQSAIDGCADEAALRTVITDNSL